MNIPDILKAITDYGFLTVFGGVGMYFLIRYIAAKLKRTALKEQREDEVISELIDEALADHKAKKKSKN